MTRSAPNTASPCLASCRDDGRSRLNRFNMMKDLTLTSWEGKK